LLHFIDSTTVEQWHGADRTPTAAATALTPKKKTKTKITTTTAPAVVAEPVSLYCLPCAGQTAVRRRVSSGTEGSHEALTEGASRSLSCLAARPSAKETEKKSDLHSYLHSVFPPVAAKSKTTGQQSLSTSQLQRIIPFGERPDEVLANASKVR
jgi:hypothetical protein